MSNLYKPNFVGLAKIAGDPFVIEVNSRIDEKVNMNNKIIRPIEEKTDDESDEAEGKENDPSVEAMLNESADMARAIKEEAEAAARSIIEEAELKAEEIRKAAEKEGFEQGLRDGKAEAAAQNEEYLAELHEKQEQLAAISEQKVEEFCDDAEAKLVDFTCEIIKKFTGILVDDYKPVIIHMINEALNGEETGKNVVIKVPEESYTYINDNKERISLAANPAVTLEIFADAKLTNRECIIETDNGIIDLSMDIQVNNLVTAMKLLL